MNNSLKYLRSEKEIDEFSNCCKDCRKTINRKSEYTTCVYCKKRVCSLCSYGIFKASKILISNYTRKVVGRVCFKCNDKLCLVYYKYFDNETVVY